MRGEKRGIFATEERRSNIVALLSFCQKMRKQGELELVLSRTIAEFGLKFGWTEKKTLEYFKILEGNNFIHIDKQQDVVILDRRLEDGV